MEIKDRILKAMHDNGINARELSKRSGLSEPTISRYLSGQMEPRANAAAKMSKALHVDPSWLMCIDDIEIELEPITRGLTPENIARLQSYADYLRSTQEDNE